MKVDYTAFLTKSGILLAVLWVLPLPWSILLSLFLTWVYQYVLAFVFGVHAMPTMDALCFAGDENIRVNVMSFAIIDRFEFETVRERIRSFMRDKPKLRWKIVEIFGDYYWKDTTVDESIDYCFTRMPLECKDERDMESIVNKHLNSQMPLDKPQWQMWYQENYQEKYSIVMYKAHHSLSDGVSSMNYHIGQGDKFDVSALMPIRKMSLIQRWMIRLSFIFYVPRLLLKIYRIKDDKNVIHPGGGPRKLSGIKISATSSDILFKDVKAAAKHKKVTINDLITAGMASGVK